MLISEPIVSVLYQRGAFDADAAEATALATAIYGVGLPAFVLQKVFQPLYFARGDTKTPFRFALVAMIVNAAIAVGLSPVIGFSAAAWAAVIAGWAMLLLLWRGAGAMGDAATFDDRLRRRALRIVYACVTMGIVLLATEAALGASLYTDGWRYAALCLLIGAGIGSYFTAAQLFGAASLAEIRGAMRRRRPQPPPA